MQRRTHESFRRALTGGTCHLASHAPFVPDVRPDGGYDDVGHRAWDLDRFVDLVRGELRRLRDDARGLRPPRHRLDRARRRAAGGGGRGRGAGRARSPPRPGLTGGDQRSRSNRYAEPNATIAPGRTANCSVRVRATSETATDPREDDREGRIGGRLVAPGPGGRTAPH